LIARRFLGVRRAEHGVGEAAQTAQRGHRRRIDRQGIEPRAIVVQRKALPRRRGLGLQNCSIRTWSEWVSAGCSLAR
jgi:hypothetical protein